MIGFIFIFYYDSGYPGQFARISTNLRRIRNNLLVTCTAIVARLCLE